MRLSTSKFCYYEEREKSLVLKIDGFLMQIMLIVCIAKNYDKIAIFQSMILKEKTLVQKST